jgi:hypothetical protein
MIIHTFAVGAPMMRPLSAAARWAAESAGMDPACAATVSPLALAGFAAAGAGGFASPGFEQASGAASNRSAARVAPVRGSSVEMRMVTGKVEMRLGRRDTWRSPAPY